MMEYQELKQNPKKRKTKGIRRVQSLTNLRDKNHSDTVEMGPNTSANNSSNAKKPQITIKDVTQFIEENWS